MNILDACIDEIALEGLDGISFKTLWERLELRQPPLGLDVNDNDVRRYLWKGLVTYHGLSFHSLRVPWKNPVVRQKFEPDETLNGMYIINDKVRGEENHPLVLMKDGQIRGSCATYRKRDDVTDSVRHGDVIMSLEEITKTYGDRFVIVASQNEREKALFGPVHQNTVKAEVSDSEYVLVEIVGRSRRAGEIPMASGDDFTSGIKMDKKTQFYHRKRMVKIGYISTQPFVYHSELGTKVKSTCIMFLPRFKRVVCNRMVEQLHRLGDILTESERGMEVYATLRERLDVSIKFFKQLLSYHKYFSIEFHPVSMFYTPTDEADKQRVDFCKDGRVRTVRCVKLVKHPRDFTDELEEDEEPSEDNLPSVTTICYNRTVAHEAYARLVSAGPEGMSISQFQQVFGVDNKSARAIVRSLCLSGYVFYYVMDSHRQRLMKIVARCYEKSCPMKRWTDSERGGLDKLIKKEDVKDEETSSPVKKRKFEEEILSQADESMEAETEVSGNEDKVVENQITKHTDVKELFTHGRTSRLVSAKYLARARHILEAVKAQQVVEHVYRLRKEIAELERADGHAALIDSRVMNRIINSLEDSGQIRSVKTVLIAGNRERKIHILCHPSVNPTTDSRVQAVFDKAKLELAKGTGEGTPRAREPPSVGGRKYVQQLKTFPFKLSKLPPNLDFDIKNARKYGALPKMKQIEALHKYLFYIMYGYEGVHEPDDLNTAFEQGPLEECRVYKDEYSFKRFIPPLPKRHGFDVAGWFLTGDIIWTMPLVLFCQLILVCYDLPELMELLADPVKKYIPMFRQEPSIIEKLMHRRGHVFRVLKLLTNMCQMGLLSFGPAYMKEKEQVPCFLHRHATISDTTKSKTGYCMVTPNLDYPKTVYTFNAFSDLDDYWNHLQYISMNTPLGALRKDSDQPEKFDYKQLLAEGAAALKPYCDPKLPGQVSDTGEVPGDGRGAAGLDTTFFAHRKSNWTHGTLNPFSMKEHYRDPVRVKLAHQPLAKLIKRKDQSELGKSVPLYKNLAKKIKKKTKQQSSIDTRKPGSASPYVPDLYAACQPSTSKQVLPDDAPPTVATPTEHAAPPSSRIRPVKSCKTRGCTRARASKGIVFDRYDVKVKKKSPGKELVKKPKSKLKPRPFVARVRKVRPNKDLHTMKDSAALRRMRTLRVRWTTGEDNMLLWFKIGHLFLGYHDVIMSWPDLRDILNKYFPVVSMDKTSKACARRLLFMCRNANTTRTINLLANQALHNEELVAKYNFWRVKKKDVIRADKFDELIIDLKTMLKSAPTDTKLPDTLEQLHELYTLQSCDLFSKVDCTKHKDVVTVQDVCESTVHSLIHSTVWLGDERAARSVDLFKVYKQYPDSLLTTMCRRMVNDRMISKLRIVRGTSMTCSLTSMKSYQLSQRYNYMLAQINHHPNAMFQHCLEPYQQLTQGFSQGIRHEVDCTDVDNVGLIINLVTYTAMRKLIYTVNIPEHLIVVEMGNEDEEIGDEAGDGLTVPPAQTQSDDEDDELITELTSRRKDEDPPGEESWNQSKNHLKENLKDMKLSHASRFLLSMARHHHFRSLQETTMKPRLSSHDVMAVKPCDVRVRFKKSIRQQPSSIDVSLVQGILRQMEDVQPDDIDYASFLARCQTLMGYDECVQVDKLHKTIADQKQTGLTRHELVCLCPELVLLESRLGILLAEKVVIKVGVTVDRYVSYQYIRHWLVHAYKSRPAIAAEVKSNVDLSDDSVQLDATPTGQYQTDANQSAVSDCEAPPSASESDTPMNEATATDSPQPSSSKAVGVRKSPRRREKSAASGDEIKKSNRVTERVRVFCRPWKYPEGPINKAALKRFLEAILLSVLAQPGISETAMEEKFNPILQPVQIRELLEILTQVDCLRVDCFEKAPTCTLFSPRQHVQYATYDDGQLEKNYVPTVDSIIKMGQLLDQIEKWTSTT